MSNPSGLLYDCVGEFLDLIFTQFKGRIPQSTPIEFDLYIADVGNVKFTIPMPDAGHGKPAGGQ